MSAGGLCSPCDSDPKLQVQGCDDLRPETTATFYRIYGKVHSFRPVPEMRKD